MKNVRAAILFIAVVLISALSIDSAITHQEYPQSSAAFNDVFPGHPHEEAILYLQDEGMVKGYADGNFLPDATINRAEFIKIVVEAVLGEEPLEPIEPCFDDVPLSEWFASYVCYAYRVQLIGGYPDGTYRPLQKISFVEAAKIISRALSDVEEGIVEWYRPFVEYLERQRAIPIQITSFEQDLTRGEMAEMIFRLDAGITDRETQEFDFLDRVDQVIIQVDSDEVVELGIRGNEVTITEEDGYRFIRSNGLPNHDTGEFPNANNPNSITEQSHEFRVTLTPKRNAQVTNIRLGPIGVAVNGVPFDPGAAEFWNNDPNSGWQYEASSGAIDLGLDQNNAHVQPDGTYHYHAKPTGLLGDLDPRKHSPIVGYAADGFPIYALYGFTNPLDPSSGISQMTSSYRLRNGERLGGPGGQYDGSFMQDYAHYSGYGSLGECNGRYGITPEYPKGIYHYFITDNYPFMPRCLWGDVDPSFQMTGPGPGGERAPAQGPVPGQQGQAGPTSGPPQAALNACSNKSDRAFCVFSDRGRTLTGLCQNTRDGLACVPDDAPVPRP